MPIDPREEDAAWSGGDGESAGPEDEALDRAWAALDASDPERALRELDAIDADWPDRWIPEALARTELGDLRGARHALDRVREAADVEDHPDWLWAEGCLRLAEWRVPEAREALERLARVERSVGALDRLSLCLEVAGDSAGAERLLREAHALDPAGSPLPPRMSPADFERVVAAAIDELPPQFRRPLETTEVVVEAVPAEWMVDRSDPSGTPPDALGLFVGPSDTERSGDEAAALPRRIFLFQRNLERAAHDEAHLLEEIRKTLFHEIGHMLGFDEEGVADLGLE